MVAMRVRTPGRQPPGGRPWRAGRTRGGRRSSARPARRTPDRSGPATARSDRPGRRRSRRVRVASVSYLRGSEYRVHEWYTRDSAAVTVVVESWPEPPLRDADRQGVLNRRVPPASPNPDTGPGPASGSDDTDGPVRRAFDPFDGPVSRPTESESPLRRAIPNPVSISTPNERYGVVSTEG